MTDIPGFHNRPRVTELPRNMFYIAEPLTYEWIIHDIPQMLTIPASPEKPYVFDGASIPVVATFITWILPFMETIYPMGLHIYAAAFHDFLFEYQGRVPEDSHLVKKNGIWVPAHHIWSFTECNRFFGRLLKEDGVGRIERNVMEAAVQSPIGYYNFRKGKVPEDAQPC